MKNSALMESQLHFRLFFELPHEGYRALFLWKFQYDEETDWYEGRVFRGEELVGYMHGYANRGWNPQVNNIWVVESFRRKGVASAMMARVESFFGQVPLPGTRVEDNPAARGFWDKYLSGKGISTKPRDPWRCDMSSSAKDHEPTVRFRFYFRVPLEGVDALFLLEFRHDDNTDWYETRVFRGGDLVGYMRGSSNPGWNPQVTQIWVAEPLRRSGIASIMMSKVEGYFGQIPLPAVPYDTATGAREFWKQYSDGKESHKRRAIEPDFDPSGLSKGTEKGARFRQFFEFPNDREPHVFKLDFYYDEALNWYEARVLCGDALVGLLHGHANVGWNPQVTHIWISPDHRKKGIATVLMSRVTDFFGQIPLPTVPLDETSPAKSLWDKFMARGRASSHDYEKAVLEDSTNAESEHLSEKKPVFSNDEHFLCCPECGAILKNMKSE